MNNLKYGTLIKSRKRNKMKKLLSPNNWSKIIGFLVIAILSGYISYAVYEKYFPQNKIPKYLNANKINAAIRPTQPEKLEDIFAPSNLEGFEKELKDNHNNKNKNSIIL